MMRNVGIHCTALPDGVVKSNGNLRVSLLLTPDAINPNHNIALSDWPSALHEIKVVYVHVFDVNGIALPNSPFKTDIRDSNWVPSDSSKPRSFRFKPNQAKEVGKKAKALWHDLFRDRSSASSEPRFDLLHDYLRARQNAQTLSINGRSLRRSGGIIIDASAGPGLLPRSQLADALASYFAHQTATRICIADIAGMSAADITSLGLGSGLVESASRFRARPFVDAMTPMFLSEISRLVPAELRPDGLGRLASHEQDAATALFRSGGDGEGRLLVGSVSLEATKAAWRRRLQQYIEDAAEYRLAGETGQPPAGPTLKAPDVLFEDGFESQTLGIMASALAAHEGACPIESTGPAPTAKCEESPDALTVEDCSRKFAGIMSHPTLAKFLYFIVDIEIPAKVLGNHNSGFLAADFPVAGDVSVDGESRLDRTAFIRKGNEFRCAARSEVVVSGDGVRGLLNRNSYTADLPIRSGVVAGNHPRFRIDVIESAQSLRALVQKAVVASEMISEGSLPEQINAKLPEPQDNGLQLLDTQVFERTIAQISRADGFAALQQGTGKTYFAEDLVIGIRPDVRRTRFASQGTFDRPDDWRSLTARRVTYKEVNDAFGYGGSKDWHPYPEFRFRDHGVVRLGSKMIPNKREAGEDTTHSPAPSEVMFAWKGNSLGVPSVDERGREEAGRLYDEVEVCPHADLGVTIEYRLSRRYPCPSLRIGDGYEFAMRAVLPNGGGLRLSDAVAGAYQDPDNRTGSRKAAKTAPYIYAIHDDVRTPTLLISGDDPLVVGRHQSTPNERDDRVVLRTGGTLVRKKATRFLVPSRITSERAEQYGMFDKQLDADIPKGAFENLRRDPKDGSFPAARQGTVRFEAPNENGPVTGSVLAFEKARGRRRPRATGYFPDPQSQVLNIALERDGRAPTGYQDTTLTRHFWFSEKNESALDARPVLLEFVARSDFTEGGRVYATEDVSFGRQSLPRVMLELAPAEIIRVWYWATPEPEWSLLRNARLQQGIVTLVQRWPNLIKRWPGLVQLGSNPDTIAAAVPHGLSMLVKPLLDRISSSWAANAFNGLGGWGKIEVVHAVERPVEDALPIPVNALPGGFGLKVVRIRPETQWLQHAGKPADISDHGLSVEDEPGGTVAHCLGALRFHRKSTGEIRVNVSWRDTSASDAVVRDERTGLWRQRERWAQVDLAHSRTIPYQARPETENVFDLFTDESGALRQEFHDFADCMARRIRFEISATSRFVRDYVQDAISDEDARRNRFVRKSGSRFGGDAPGENELVFETWMEGTARPEKPRITRTSWVTLESTRTTSDGVIVLQKRCHPRIYIDSGFSGTDWRRAGEDAMLAVLLAPDDVVGQRRPHDWLSGSPIFEPAATLPSENGVADEVRRIQLSELAECGRLSAVAPYVARWGADPTTQSGRLDWMMSVERFSGFDGSEPSVFLPMPTTSNDDRSVNSQMESGQKVAVLLFRPKLDELTGEWYVDVGLDPGAAHMPFVRLGVALYQEHTIRRYAGQQVDMRLSEPVVLNPLQIPATRTVEVRSPDRSRIEVTIRGIGFTRRRFDRELGIECSELTDTPLQNVRLLRKVGTGGSIAAFDHYGEPAFRERLIPVSQGPDLLWRCTFHLPKETRFEWWRLDIDEVELHPADMPTPTCDDEFRERPAMFACTIDLDGLSSDKI